MKKMNYALLVLLAFVLASCSAYKQVPYLQASEYLDTSGQNTPLYDARIMPKDLLTITVNTTDPETAAPFNLTVATHQERSRKPHQREAENLHHGSTHRQCTHGQL